MLKHSLNRLKILQHAVAVVRDTSQTERVFEVSEGISRDPEFAAKYPLSPVEVAFTNEPFEQGFPSLDALRAMPENSLGAALAAHMDDLGVDFSTFDRRPTPQDQNEWIECHNYETHDIWHVVTGWGTGTANEVGLLAFVFGQIGQVRAAVLLMLGLGRSFVEGQEAFEALLSTTASGWLQGRRSKALYGVDWRPRFERPLAEVRAEFGVEPVDSSSFAEVDSVFAT